MALKKMEWYPLSPHSRKGLGERKKKKTNRKISIRCIFINLDWCESMAKLEFHWSLDIKCNKIFLGL